MIGDNIFTHVMFKGTTPVSYTHLDVYKRQLELLAQNDIMEEQEAMALTRAYTTLRDELHHLALHTHHAACHIKWNFPTGNTPVHQIADQVI